MLETRAQEWKRQLIADGKAEMFLHLIRRRHKVLPPGTEDRVRAADKHQLDERTDRFADGLPLNEIFCAALNY